jgi:rhodanese-related sulfurtransferase
MSKTIGIATGKRWMRQAAAIVLLAAIPALAATLWHPHKPEWSRSTGDTPEISWDRARALKSGVLWIDARKADDFQRGHIDNALSLDEARWEDSLPGVIAAWHPGATIVVYCDGADCGTSRSVARRLKRELGVSGVYVLKGGWREWPKTTKR